MQLFMPSIVWRHRKENLKKCSLRGLEIRPDFQFFTYPGSLPEISNYVLLTLDAPPLSKSDSSLGLFIVDATWRYAERMLKVLNTSSSRKLIRRSLPENFRTAYPRCQSDCIDPERGLASIEAIYLAYLLLGRDCTGLLDGYYWKDQFLEKNNL